MPRFAGTAAASRGRLTVSPAFSGEDANAKTFDAVDSPFAYEDKPIKFVSLATPAYFYRPPCGWPCSATMTTMRWSTFMR